MRPLLADPEWTGKLVEGTVVTHYRRYYPTFYIKAEGEVDVAYIEQDRFRPVEVKWTGQFPFGKKRLSCHVKGGSLECPPASYPRRA